MLKKILIEEAKAMDPMKASRTTSRRPQASRMTEDPDLIDYLLLLRFGPSRGRDEGRPVLNYASVARLAKRPVATVRDLITMGLQALKDGRPIQQRKRTKLQGDHVAYLCSPQTLTAWAHLSLQQRARMFHRTFPELKISATLLARTYKQHGVKFKFIRRGKKVIDYADPHYLCLFTDMYRAVRSTRHQDVKLVWVDEAVFTFNTFSTRAWSARRGRIQVQDADARVKTMAFIAAISEDCGLEAWAMHPNSISTPEFVAFVEQLSAKFHGAEFAIFMDNLTVHKTQAVAEACKSLNVRRIFNVPYSPDFNGIEAYFSMLKGEYKKLILQRLLKGFKVDSQALIRQSVELVDKEKTQRCVQHGLKSIMAKAQELNMA